MVTDTDGRCRRHTADERRAVLARFSASGASVAAFCRSESICAATLRRWRAESLDDDAPRAIPPGFLDLGALDGGAVTLEVELGGGIVLRVRRG